MLQRLEGAVGSGAELHLLPGVGPVAEGEHLVARQHDPDRALEVERGHDGEKHLVLRAQPRAEGAADERRDHPDVVLREAEDVGDVALGMCAP